MAASAGTDLDLYESYYTAKLWKLLPAVYRAADSDDAGERGPLAELVARLGAQAAILRRSIDRLWEDQSIESCDDWVIAYLGDLLATSLVTRLDARGQRVDVAKTIYYRRRKGTVAVLEQLARDITGWSARVVEFFRRLARTRHLLDPPFGAMSRDAKDPRLPLQRAEGLIGTRTRTPAGGLADLRDGPGAVMTSTAFDEYFHTGDVRRGRGNTGWHNIPRLGVFVWRKKTALVQRSTPVPDAGCLPQHTPPQDGFSQFTFDPTGRDITLFAQRGQPLGDRWVTPEPQQMPGPLTPSLLASAFTDLYPGSLAIRDPAPDYTLVPAEEVAPDPRTMDGKPAIDPVRGRIFWPPKAPPKFFVDYGYGFSSDIGAGPYERPAVPAPEGPSLTVRPPIVEPPTIIPAATSEVVELGSSLTYPRIADFPAIARVVVRAGSQQRPVLRLPAGIPWELTGAGGAQLTLDGLFLSGGSDVILSGDFAQVTISCCTLDPGTWDPTRTPPTWGRAADRRALAPTLLRIAGTVHELVIDRSITGPILTEGAGIVRSLIIRDSIIQNADPTAPAEALSLPDTDLTATRVSLLGAARVHRIEASECILDGVVHASDRQQGCVRFCAWTKDSRIPRQYESVMLTPGESLFASRDFGKADYAQLLDTAASKITAGAEDGSEMGAFCREMNSVKERALLIKYQEYLPLGLEPVVIHVT